MIRIPAGRYDLVNKLSYAKIRYDNSISLMDFRLNKREKKEFSKEGCC